MRGFSKLVQIVLWMALLSLLASAQTRKPQSPGGVDWGANSWGRGDDAAFMLNLPNAPLTLAASQNNRDILLSNETSKLIISYRLGAVVKRKGALHIVHTRDSVRIDLKDGQLIMNPIGIDDGLQYARKKKAKLAVVEVMFSDGSLWDGTATLKERS